MSFSSLLQLGSNLIGLIFFNFIMALVTQFSPLGHFLVNLARINFHFSTNDIQALKFILSTKLIMQNYFKTNYKIHELTK